MPRTRRRKRRMTPEDLTRITSVGDPQIAPDGQNIAFVHKRVGRKNKYDTNIWLVPAGGGDPTPFTASGKDSSPRWSPDSGRIAFVSRREDPGPQVFVINAGGGEARQLTNLPEGSIGEFRWSPDGRQIAISFRETHGDWTKDAKKQREEKGLSDPPLVIEHHWYRLDGDGYFNRQRYALHLVDVETGEHRKVYDKDTLGFFTFDFSPDSKELVIGSNRDRRAGLRAWNDELLRLRISTGKITPIPNLPDGPKDSVRWSPDGKLIAYAGRRGPDAVYSTENLELWVCDPKTGKARCLTGKEDYCLLGPPMSDTAEIAIVPVFEWSPDSRRLWTQLGWHGEQHLASVRRGGGAITFHTNGQIVHGMGNLSANGRRMALTIGSATKLDEIAVAEIRGNDVTTTMLTDLNGPLLAELELSRPTSKWITSPDGNKVQVWCIKPPGHKGNRRVPAVLEIHGGPHLQYGVGFFHEFQVLAANGYAVFYSNPRGSKGYGRDHCDSIRGAWGGTDWTDLEAVATHMAEQPFVDTKRMGVMGGSYGGYMTVWAIGHTNVFAGAIADRCVSNLVSMFGNSDFVDVPDLYWEGNCWDRPEARWAQSPVRYLGNARTPTLIIHSEGDLRCNIEQAEEVHGVLCSRRVPTRFVRYPRTTSHGMSRCGPPDMRLHRLHQILDWWERYLC